MITKITLTTAGIDTTSFTLHSDADNYAATLATVSRSQLLAGYDVTVPSGTTIVKVQATGACSTSILLSITATTAAPANCQVWTATMAGQVQSGESMTVNAVLCDGNSITYVLYEGESVNFCGTITSSTLNGGTLTSGSACTSAYRSVVLASSGNNDYSACASSSYTNFYMPNGSRLLTATNIFSAASGGTRPGALFFREASTIGWRQWTGTAFGGQGECVSTDCKTWTLTSSNHPSGEFTEIRYTPCEGGPQITITTGGQTSQSFCADIDFIEIVDMPGWDGVKDDNMVGGYSNLTATSQSC